MQEPRERGFEMSYKSYASKVDFDSIADAREEADGLWSEFVYCVASDMKQQACEYASSISYADDKDIKDADDIATCHEEWLYEDAQDAFDNHIIFSSTNFKCDDCGFTKAHADTILMSPAFWDAVEVVDDASGNEAETMYCIDLLRSRFSSTAVYFHELYYVAQGYIECTYEPESYQSEIVDCIADVWSDQLDKALATA